MPVIVMGRACKRLGFLMIPRIGRISLVLWFAGRSFEGAVFCKE